MAFPISPIEGQRHNKYIFSNNLWKLAPEPGSVIQVVQFIRPGSTAAGSPLLTQTSGSWGNIMSVSITPKFVNSRFFIKICFTAWSAGAGISSAKTRVVRDSTQIDFIRYTSLYKLHNVFETTNYKIIDTPNTLSQITYTVQCALTEGYEAKMGYADDYGSEHASITVEEIAS